MALEDDKLETLRRWGQGLREAGAEEQAAFGRAILMLIEEIERLRLELLRTREQGSQEPASGEAALDGDEQLPSTLRRRVQQAVRRHPEPTGSAAGSEQATESPEAWIESLRRQD
jgi:hypothetical protein